MNTPQTSGGADALRQLMRYWTEGTQPFKTFRDALEYIPNLQPLVDTPYGESSWDMVRDGLARRKIVVDRFWKAAGRVSGDPVSVWAHMPDEKQVDVYVELLGGSDLTELSITLHKNKKIGVYWIKGFTTPIVDILPQPGWEIYDFGDGNGVYRRATTLKEAIDGLCPPEEE